MKFVVRWSEQPQGSPEAYENAQKRILEIFAKWEWPKSFKIHQFVTRVGTWSGYLIVETDSLSEIQQVSTIFASFKFEVEPVMDVPDAVAAEMAGMKWRDGVKA